MYNPDYVIGKNNVPILSREQIEVISENFIEDFNAEYLSKPMAVDIDRFSEFYLGITPDYHYLTHNLLYLGMAVFEDTNSVIIYNASKNEAEYIKATANTILIDKRLLECNQEHRYRFTLAHECGHLIFHKAYFKALKNKLSPNNIFMQCKQTEYIKGEKHKLVSDSDWLEWQANQFSSCILMPRSAINAMICDYDIKSKEAVKALIANMSKVFNVSVEAAVNRLSQLKK